ncbi:MAG: hypothetical protein BalsKO_25970 [Balneolaceae bacterium]
MTHNSHLNRSFSSENNSYSATASIEVFLAEVTNYEEIDHLRVVDENLTGWIFTKEEIANAYIEFNNSLRFEQLDLRSFDFISGKILSAQILDENDEIIFERTTQLGNNFPLPSFTSVSVEESSALRMEVDFFETPYDGGNTPFPTTYYNTYFSSNAFSVVWLDGNKSEFQENFLNLGDLNPVSDPNPDDIYEFFYSLEEVPNGSSYFYLKFRRGSETSGRILYNQILEVPEQ